MANLVGDNWGKIYENEKLTSYHKLVCLLRAQLSLGAQFGFWGSSVFVVTID